MRFWRLRTLSMFIYMSFLLMVVGAVLSYVLRFSIIAMAAIMMSLSILLSLYSYFRCKENALRANRARIVSEMEEPRLYRIIREVAYDYNLPMPEVGIVESWTPNAFATGRNPKNAAVVATRGLLEMLPDDELKGVMAHEMAHVKDRDILVMSFASMMASLISNLSYIAYFALIFNANAHTDASLPQLYGGAPTDPVPVYQESDEILEALFPRNKTIFLMCQSGGRVSQLMNLLKARGWDMSKVYNVGGMAQYAGAEYRDIVTDTAEITVTATYSFEGLTRIAP